MTLRMWLAIAIAVACLVYLLMLTFVYDPFTAQADEITPDQGCPDFNADQNITGSDLSVIAAVIGQPIGDVRDLNGDGSVTGADLSFVAATLGTRCLPENFDVHVATVNGSTEIQGSGEGPSIVLDWWCDIHLRSHIRNSSQTHKELTYGAEVFCWSTPSFNLQVTCMGKMYRQYDWLDDGYEMTTFPQNPALCTSVGGMWAARGIHYWIRPCYRVVHYATGTLLGWGCLEYGTVDEFYIW